MMGHFEQSDIPDDLLFDLECDESFQEYRQFMIKNFNMILENKEIFISDPYFSPAFKYERIKELIDFFEVEDEFENCSALQSIHNAIEIDYLFTKVYKEEDP